MPLTVLDGELPMLPSAACWVTIQFAAAWAAANCGICGGADAALAGAAIDSRVADVNNVARPTAKAPRRVRRTKCMVLAFPDLDPENSAPAGSHRAPVLVSRRWELFLTLRYPGS